MKLVYEYQQGAMTYGCEYELVQRSVVERELRYATGEPRGGLKPAKKTLATTALAEKYLRWKVTLAVESAWSLVEGVAPTLDSREHFRDVMEKTSAYRYFEHVALGQFCAIDLDASNFVVQRGAIGERGSEELVETNWDGEAKAAYAAKTDELVAGGYELVDGKPLKAKPQAKPVRKSKKSG